MILPRSTIKSPLDIADCLVWLDGSDQSTMTFSSGRLTQWVDKANGYAFESRYSDPPYETTSPRGGSVGEWQSSINELFYPLDTSILPGNTTFGVGRLDVQNGAYPRMVSAAGTDSSNVFARYTDFSGDGNTIFFEGSSVPAGTTVLRHSTRTTSGVIYHCYIGAACGHSGSPPYYYSGGIDEFGPNQCWLGPIYETVIYGRVLSDDEIVRVKWYLSQKWQTPFY